MIMIRYDSNIINVTICFSLGLYYLLYVFTSLFACLIWVGGFLEEKGYFDHFRTKGILVI